MEQQQGQKNIHIDDGGSFSIPPWNFPLDDRDKYFKKEYHKNDIIVRVGYYITYKPYRAPNDKDTGKYRIEYIFSRPSIKLKENELQVQKRIKEEQNSKRAKQEDANQF